MSPPMKNAYATRHTTLILVLISVCFALLAENVENRFPLPLLARVVMWGVVVVIAVSVTMLAYAVFPRRHKGMRPPQMAGTPELFTTHQMALMQCVLLLMLAGMAFFVLLVPPHFEPLNDLRQLRGPVTECRPKKGDFCMRVLQEGEEPLVRVHPFLTDQLSSIAVGDDIIALMDGAYATELHWNGQVLFTYDDYKLNMRNTSLKLAVLYALSALGVGVWLRYKKMKECPGSSVLSNGSGT